MRIILILKCVILVLLPSAAFSNSFSKSFVEAVKEFENAELARSEDNYIDYRRVDRHGKGQPLEVGYGFTQAGIEEAIRYGFLKSNFNLPKTMSKKEADDLLENAILPAFGCIVDKTVKVPLTPYQREALVSFTYNLGRGNLILLVNGQNRLNAGNYEDVPDHVQKYCFAGKKVLRGLQRRRLFEATLWRSK